MAKRRAAKRRKAGSSRTRKVAKPRKRRAKARKAAPKRKATAPKRRPLVKSKAKKAAARRTKRVAPKRKRPAKSSRSARPASHPAARPASRPSARPVRMARLDRVRRTLDDVGPTPPSSLNLNRHGSAVRTGRAGMAESLQEHPGMTPAITGGDVDANWENAYFSGDEAPGGDNPTPDQEVVEDIGRSLGVEYQDNEELKAADKVAERDRKRWELDPASSEDYRDRK